MNLLWIREFPFIKQSIVHGSPSSNPCIDLKSGICRFPQRNLHIIHELLHYRSCISLRIVKNKNMINQRVVGLGFTISPPSLTILALKSFLTNNYKKRGRIWGKGTNFGGEVMLKKFHWGEEQEESDIGLAEESDQAKDL